MRLIDADELMAKVNEIKYLRKRKAQMLVDECNEVEAVPVIRCKDCEHWQCDDVDTYCDELGIFGTDMNSYCSYAKKGNK